MKTAIHTGFLGRVRCAILIFLLLAGHAGLSFAVPISAIDLFLSPTLVPEDDYVTSGRTFSTNADALTLNFSSSTPYLPVGSSIIGARVLPLLNPNPATAMGEYNTAALAGINASNFATYFFRQPGADYAADLTGGVLMVDFLASGQYFLGLDYDLGGTPGTALFHVEVNDFFGGDGAADRAAVSRRIDGPTTDFNVVSTTPAGDNKYADNAAAELTGRLGAARVARAGTLQDACDKIKAASEKAGRKISVSLVGHGRPGSIRLGSERINSGGDGVMTPTQFQQCIDKYVSRIEFWSCNTAENDIGSQFLRDFAASVGVASGFTVTVTAAQTYWDTKAGARGLDTVPEPGSLLLVSLGLVLLVMSRRFPGDVPPAVNGWARHQARRREPRTPSTQASNPPP